MLASIIGLVAEDSAASPAIGLTICLVFNYVFTAFTPYRNKSSNILGIVLTYALTFFFIAGE
jgi:hypothetical protein